MVSSNPKSEIRNPKSVLPPPQFGLRTLLLVVTGCAILAAMSNWLAPVALAGVVLLVLAVMAHVAGNAIGTRLRELGSQRPADADSQAGQDLNHKRPEAGDFAPATRLGQRYALGWLIIIGTLAGVLVGGVGGGIWTLNFSHGPAGPLTIIVGVVAFAVLNGIAAFVVVGFIQVLAGAIRQALDHARTSASPTGRQSEPTLKEGR